MDDLTQDLVEGIRTWREHNITDYWIRVSYLGGELNRFGDHELTQTKGKLYHLWQDRFGFLAVYSPRCFCLGTRHDHESGAED